MPENVKVPVIGSMSRNKLLFGVVAAGGVTAYLLYRHNKQQQAAAAASYGYGATGYGYGSGVPGGYYGYGYGYGSAPSFGGGMTPYPVGSEYGYGAYGYGYYNPYTGQWLGPGQQTPPSPFQSQPSQPSGTGKPGTSVITTDGHHNLAQYGHQYGTSRRQLIAWNPQLAVYLNTGKPIKRGLRIKV